MDQRERARLRPNYNALCDRSEMMRPDPKRQQQALVDEALRKLEAIAVQATSSDQAVEVSVDAFGVLIEVELAPWATQATAEQLGSSIIEAAQQASRLAHQQRDALITPIIALIDAVRDQPGHGAADPNVGETKDFKVKPASLSAVPRQPSLNDRGPS
ncbi:YbaB/EbfC family nucleoid-associated protein [Nocardia gipuzkoensis]